VVTQYLGNPYAELSSNTIESRAQFVYLLAAASTAVPRADRAKTGVVIIIIIIIIIIQQLDKHSCTATPRQKPRHYYTNSTPSRLVDGWYSTRRMRGPLLRSARNANGAHAMLC